MKSILGGGRFLTSDIHSRNDRRNRISTNDDKDLPVSKHGASILTEVYHIAI